MVRISSTGKDRRSLPRNTLPWEANLEQALQLLAQPKRGSKQLIKTFAESPVTGNVVQLMEGRYGPYVADGATNASLPRDMNPDELTFEKALDLLAERAAKAPPKKKRGQKRNPPRPPPRRRRPRRRPLRRRPPRRRLPRRPPRRRSKAADRYAASNWPASAGQRLPPA
jgi:DNA topoisomerase I